MQLYEKTLKDKFGYNGFRDKQLEIIKAVLEDKRDVCVTMFTGAGKSLCYQFPPVHTEKIALVVSPLIALMKDQVMKMDELGIPSCALNGTIVNKNFIKDEILENRYRIVFMTPEYLITQQDFLEELYSTGLLVLVCADEGHTISMWGNDFRPAYQKLNCLKDWFPNLPMMSLTATATTKVENDIVNTLGLKKPLMIKTSFDRPNLFIKLIPKGKKFITDLIKVIDKDEPTIIYCQTRSMTDEISTELKKYEIISDSYHAGMSTTERNEVHENLTSGKIKCIVATVAFGMGIDIVIRKVIHYGIPKDMESYYQEIGRAGRDGIRSECLLFYALGDMNNNNYFINKITNITYRNRMTQLALTMKNYIFSSECRRKYVLEYFGEAYTKENCALCDNCLTKKNVITHDFAKCSELLLKTMNLTGNVYGGTMIINILRGSGSKTIPKVYTKSTLFGSGKQFSEAWWKILMRILINNEYVREKPISGGHAFTLCIAQKGLKWLELKKQKDDTTLIFQVPNDMVSMMPKTKPTPGIYINIPKDDIDLTKKKSTMDTTYQLYQENKSIQEISKELKIKPQTTETHINKLYAKGHDLDLDKLGFTDDVYDTISSMITELDNPSQLKTIKDSLPNKVSYLQIKLTKTRMDKEKDGVIVVKGKKVKVEPNDLLASMKTTQELCIIKMNKANQKMIKDKEMTNKTSGDYFDIMNAYNQMKH